jgi:SAM-dependent methyltransferase
MRRDAIQERLISEYYGGEHAGQYEDEAGHGWSDDERNAFEEDVREAVAIADPNAKEGLKILDVGTGTGQFARLLAEWGHNVHGIDIAPDMLAQARHRIPESLRQRLSFELYDCQDPASSSRPDAGSYDYVVSRQVIGHFDDPIAAFSNWRHWLKEGGRTVVVDGLWSREGWRSEKGSNDDLIDSLPLACTQSRGTVQYLLRQAGFVIEYCGWLERVNAAMNWKHSSPRYLVVARKDGAVSSG